MKMQHRMNWIAALALTIISATAVQAAEGDLSALEEQAFKEAAALVNPSIVRILTVGGLDRVGGVLAGTAPTTGVIVSRDGDIISSAFNFASKPASILVELPDGRKLPARMVASDEAKMLTLLKIDADNLTPAPAADKKTVRVGDWAVAMGRSYGNEFPSMSIGIVSAVGRIWGKAVQTDAKVSPTNYGGPLVNVEGKVIGILVPLSPQGSTETAGVEWYDSGIGFAIPLEDIYASLKRLQGGEDLKPGLLGVAMPGRDLLSGKPQVDRVRYNSPAAKAGLQPGDLIVSVDGKPVVRQAEFKHAIGNKYAGDDITITVSRDGRELTETVTLAAELPPYEPAFLGILPERLSRAGASSAGVGVRVVVPNSPAARGGLQPRDRIVRFNETAVTGSTQLAELVSRVRPGEQVTLAVVRGDRELRIDTELAMAANDVLPELSPVVIPPPKARPKPPAAEDGTPAAESPEGPRTGRFSGEVPENEFRFWAYVPADYNPDHAYSLMVWIHPGGDTMEAAIYQQWRAICEKRGIIMLGPQAEKIAGWQPHEVELIKAATEYMRQLYTIDDRRIFLHGYDQGGRLAYQLAFKHRDLYRGAATAAAPLNSRPVENEPDVQLQFHLVCGDKDNARQPVEASAQLLRNMKFPVSLRIVEGKGRDYPAGATVEEIGRWADSLDRI